MTYEEWKAKKNKETASLKSNTSISYEEWKTKKEGKTSAVIPKKSEKNLSDTNVNPVLPIPKREPSIPFYDERLSTLVPAKAGIKVDSKDIGKSLGIGTAKGLLGYSSPSVPLKRTGYFEEQMKQKREEDFQPQTGLGKASMIIGQETGNLPLWLSGERGLAFAAQKGLPFLGKAGQVADKLPKIAKGGALDAATYGAVVAPAETLLEGDNLRSLADREKFAPFVGIGGIALRGAGSAISKGLKKPIQESVAPEAFIQDVQNAYRTPSLRDVRQYEQNLKPPPKSYEFKTKAQMARQKELEEVFSQLEPPYKVEHKTLLGGISEATGVPLNHTQTNRAQIQSELESLWPPVRTYKKSNDIKLAIQEIENEKGKIIDGFVSMLKEADKTGEKNILQRVREKGGIAPSRTGDVRGEYSETVPIWLRDKNGRPIDEIADELGLTSSELLSEMMEPLNKVGRKTKSDYLDQAHRLAYNEPEYQALEETLQILEGATPDAVTLKYRPKIQRKKQEIASPKAMQLSGELPVQKIRPRLPDVRLKPRHTSPFTDSSSTQRAWTNRDNIPISQPPRIESITPENIGEILGGKASTGIETLPKQEVRTLAEPAGLKQAAASIEDDTARLIDNNIQREKPKKTLSEPDIPEGQKERGVNRNLRTDENRPLEMREDLTNNPNTYDPLNNPETLAKAQEIMDEGLENAVKKFGELNEKFSPESAPLLKLIADDLYKSGNAIRANELISDAAAKATEAGQYIQAWKLLRSSNDSTAYLLTLQKQIKKLNKDGLEHYGKRWRDVNLTDAELKAIGKIDPNNSDAFSEVLDKIRLRIADEMVSTPMEKINAFRHVAMLLNPKTQVRNIGGNVIMMGMRKTAQRVSALLQKVALKPEERTQVFRVGKEYKDIAKSYYKANQKDILRRLGNKYQENIKLNMPEKRVFKKGKVLGDTPEEIRKFTYAILDKGDTPFFGNAYVDRLASYAQAKGIKDFTRLGEEAFETAFKEAAQATYKEASKLATFLNSVKNTGANSSRIREYGAVATEALLPFTKTPINLIARGVQYSPVGVLNSLTRKAGAEGIDELAKGLTGTGIAGLGFLLAKSGIISGDASDDRDLREYDKATGNAAFSVLGRYTYDWAEPFAFPLVMGVEMYNSIKDKQDEVAKMEKVVMGDGDASWEDMTMAVVEGMLDGMKASGNTILDMSLMQGVQGVMSHPEGPMGGAMKQIPLNYISQFFPAAMSQAARVVDPTVRRNYVKGSYLGTVKNTLQSKVPFASKRIEPKLTPYGDEFKRVENPIGRLLQETLSPGAFAKKQAGIEEVDTEIRRLADQGYKKHIPTVVPNYIEGTKKYPKFDLTPKEVTQYQKRTGELTLVEFRKIMASGQYRRSKSEEEREKLLANAIKEAKAKAKAEIVKSRGY